jgi:hypothetical protein
LAHAVEIELALICVVNIAQLQCKICNDFVINAIAVTESKVHKFFTCLVNDILSISLSQGLVTATHA